MLAIQSQGDPGFIWKPLISTAFFTTQNDGFVATPSTSTLLSCNTVDKSHHVVAIPARLRKLKPKLSCGGSVLCVLVILAHWRVVSVISMLLQKKKLCMIFLYKTGLFLWHVNLHFAAVFDLKAQWVGSFLSNLRPKTPHAMLLAAPWPNPGDLKSPGVGGFDVHFNERMLYSM